MKPNLRNDIEKLQSDTVANTASWANIATNVKSFGAIGDGIHDDRLAIQNAINATPTGGTVFFPTTANFYAIGSTVSVSFTDKNTHVTSQQNIGIILPDTGIIMKGNVQIVPTVPMKALLFVNQGTNSKFDGITLTGNLIAEFGLFANISFHNVKFKDCCFNDFSDSGLDIWGWSNYFDNCSAIYNTKCGFTVRGASNNVTASTCTTFINCNTAGSLIGFNILRLVYSTLISCVAEFSILGFYINGQNITLLNCGCEWCDQFLDIGNADKNCIGISIDGFFCGNVGRIPNNIRVPLTKDYLVTIHDVTNICLRGFTRQLGYCRTIDDNVASSTHNMCGDNNMSGLVGGISILTSTVFLEDNSIFLGNIIIDDISYKTLKTRKYINGSAILYVDSTNGDDANTGDLSTNITSPTGTINDMPSGGSTIIDIYKNGAVKTLKRLQQLLKNIPSDISVTVNLVGDFSTQILDLENIQCPFILTSPTSTNIPVNTVTIINCPNAILKYIQTTKTTNVEKFTINNCNIKLERCVDTTANGTTFYVVNSKVWLNICNSNTVTSSIYSDVNSNIYSSGSTLSGTKNTANGNSTYTAT